MTSRVLTIALSLWLSSSVLAQSISSLAVCSNTTTKCNATSTGPWYVTPSRLSSSDYLSAVAPENADPARYFVSFDLAVKEEGNYSLIVYTPGCLQDSTCSARGIVNVSATLIKGGEDAGPTFSTELYQTNHYDKYDQVYVGHLNKSEGVWMPTVRIAPPAGSSEILMVAQKVVATYVAPVSEPDSPVPASSNHTSASSSPASSSTSPASPSGSSAATPLPSSSDHSHGSLSLAAKLGLGLGIPLAVLLLAGLVMIIWFLRRQRQKPAKKLPAEAEGTPSARREMATNANRHEMEVPVPPEYQEVDRVATQGQPELVELKA